MSTMIFVATADKRLCTLSAMQELGRRVAQRREELGLSQQDLAKVCGVSQQAIQQLESGEVVRPRYLIELAAALQWSLEALRDGGKHPEPPRSEVDFSRQHPVPDLPRDLPVYTGVRGGLDGEIIDLSHPVDWTARPPSLRNIKEAAGVLVTGSSMEPRYLPGEIIICHPRRPLTPGCFVLLEFEDGTGVVKQWVGRDDRTVRVKQLNPPKSLSYPRNKVVNVYRVIRGGEE